MTRGVPEVVTAVLATFAIGLEKGKAPRLLAGSLVWA